MIQARIRLRTMRVIAWLHDPLSFAPACEFESLMESHKHLQFKTFVMILIMIIAGPLGNVLLGKGMQSVGTTTIASASDLLHVVGRVFTTGAIWLGVASLLMFFVANILVLSWADYSFVQPASSMAYGVVALLSVFVLGEAVSPLRWAGIAIICLGVFIVGRTNPRTTEHG
jgi:drug/metabolite transporter (DMT)-like permease